MPFDQQLAVVRVLGRGLGQAAEAMRSTVLELVLQPGATEAELARSYGQEVEKLLPLVGPALDQILRIHLRQMVRTEAISAAERMEGSLPGAREVSVAFADLVGFTRLGEEVAPDELSRVADRLAELPATRCAATCAWSRRSATRRCSPRPSPASCSTWSSTSWPPPTARARTSPSCAPASPAARRSAARATGTGGR